MKHKICFLITSCFLILFYSSIPVYSENYFNLCSLNLYRFGDKQSFNSPKFIKQKNYLSKRILDADCDVVALQEVVGKTKKISYDILNNLVEALKEKLPEKTFDIILAESNDSWNRNGFLYNKEFFYLRNAKSWYRDTLPKLDYRSISWTHTRGPLSVILVPKIDNKSKFEFLILNYHLKSKAMGWKDPSGTGFEFGRLLAAAGIRNIIDKYSSKETYDSFKIYLGDRNTNTSGAASEVLSGRLALDDFQINGTCRISPLGTALCPPETFRNPDMIPIIQKKGSESDKFLGTFKIGRKEEILDEIYIPREFLKNIRDHSGDIQAGVIGEYRKGSDHLLSWVRIRID